jgi:hypothetical protein
MMDTVCCRSSSFIRQNQRLMRSVCDRRARSSSVIGARSGEVFLGGLDDAFCGRALPSELIVDFAFFLPFFFLFGFRFEGLVFVAACGGAVEDVDIDANASSPCSCGYGVTMMPALAEETAAEL